jgi:hypothetical protein
MGTNSCIQITGGFATVLNGGASSTSGYSLMRGISSFGQSLNIETPSSFQRRRALKCLLLASPLISIILILLVDIISCSKSAKL